MTGPPSNSPIPTEMPRRGVVAVVVENDRFLVIKRSQYVTAPGAYCFPGGAIEEGESEQQAVRRELMEELGAKSEPRRRLWQSVTHRRVELAWWLVELVPPSLFIPQPSEVESVHWMVAEQMWQLPELLESNRQFLRAIQIGQISLDRIA